MGADEALNEVARAGEDIFVEIEQARMVGTVVTRSHYQIAGSSAALCHSFHHEGGIVTGIHGVRSACSELLVRARDNGNHIVTMAAFRERGIQSILDEIPETGRVYFSVDIDILDLPLVPGCASAEADGLTYNELRQTIFAIVATRELAGLDVVEINPMLDVPSNSTSLLGTQLMIETAGRAVLHPDHLQRKGRSAE